MVEISMAVTTNPENPDAREAAGRSTRGLLNEILSHTSGLLRGEIDLVRAEIQENIKQAFAAIAMLVAAVVLLLTALNVVAGALAAWLAETGIGAGWAALIVGGGLAILGIILALKGKNDVKLANLAPTRSTTNLQRDARTVKEAATNEH
jgi:hypothetical protein